MAQFDNDRTDRATRDNVSKQLDGASQRRAPPDERRRQHLLLLLSSSSSSSSSSSASSSALSDGGGHRAGSRRSFVETDQTSSERGHFSGRLQQRAAGSNQLHGRQSSGSTRRQQQQQRQQQHAMSSSQSQLKPKTVIGQELNHRGSQLETTIFQVGTSRRSQAPLNRQHSDGSAIGAQLMNVLRINDELSSSSPSGLLANTSNHNDNDTMLMTHTQQQQQQQQAQKLDTRLNSSAAAPATSLAYNNNNNGQHQQVLLARQQPLMAHVMVSHAEQHQNTQYSNLTSHHHQQPYPPGQYEHYPAAADQLVHAGEHQGIFHQHHHHNHLHPHHRLQDHHNHHHHDQVAAGPSGQYQASDSTSYVHMAGEDTELRYADLDEETTRHHQHQRQQQQQQRQQEEPTADNRSLPESVVHVNEQVIVEPQHKRELAYYQHQQQHEHHDQHHHEQTYMRDHEETAIQRHRPSDDQGPLHDDPSTTLTALNSVVACEPDQREHHRASVEASGLNSSLRRSGSSSWRQNFAELSGASTSQGSGGYAGLSGRAGDPDHSFNQSSSSQHHHRLAGDSFISNGGNPAEDEDGDDNHHHRHHLSSAGLDVGAQASHSSNDMDEELKVCEWRDCGNTYMDMGEFVRHLEEKHVNLEPHEKNRYFCLWHNCKRNKQEFNARYKLLIHMRVHSGEKPYACNSSASCKKSFSRLENLKIHMRSHTGEKPYKCNYEHCSKSFTNSSDRIKHHKTHKDPKPYNCTQDGCTKRYTDPSSLRKHLRAHKREGPGPMDSSESLANSTRRYSTATTGFSSQLDHTFAQSSSATSDYKHHHQHTPHSSGHHNHHHSHHQRQHEMQQQQQQRQVHYPYMETGPPQQVDAVYDQGHHHHHHHDHHHHQHNNHHQHFHQNQQQQPQVTTYLHPDYDPSQEFASVLFSSSNASELAGSMREEAQTGGAEEANYYTNTSYERPRQQQQQQESQLTNLDELAGSNSHQNRAQPIQYGESPDQRHFGGQRPVPRFRNQIELHERHQQLSKSWCGSGSGGSSQASMRQHTPWMSELNPGGGGGLQRQGQQQQPRMVFQQDNNNQISGSPSRTRRRVVFESTPTTQNYEVESWQSSQLSVSSHQRQAEGGQQASYPNQSPDDAPHPQHQQYEQNWSSGQVVGLPGDNNHQRQFHYQQGQQQQHQNQLTRRQQHEQLMRSMPATVGSYQS